MEPKESFISEVKEILQKKLYTSSLKQLNERVRSFVIDYYSYLGGDCNAEQVANAYIAEFGWRFQKIEYNQYMKEYFKVVKENPFGEYISARTGTSVPVPYKVGIWINKHRINFIK